MSVVRCGRLPTLRTPVAILSFGGWGDAAEASTTAVGALVGEWSAQQFATIDPEDFYDFSQVRPRVYLDRSMVREIEWPVGKFSYRRRPKLPNDIVLFRAAEPQLRWQRYSSGILDFLERLHVSTVVTLGSLLADVPHTRPVQLTGFASTDELREKLAHLGINMSQYEGPTGVVGVLHDAAPRRDIPSVSLWGAAPHYIAAATNPKVALALLQALSNLMDWTFDLKTLQQEADEFDVEVDSIIRANPEASAYVRRLEERVGTSAESEGGPQLPPNDVLIRDLEEFLRRGGDDKMRGDA